MNCSSLTNSQMEIVIFVYFPKKFTFRLWLG